MARRGSLGRPRAALGQQPSQAGVGVRVGTGVSAVLGCRKAASFGGLRLKPGSRLEESAAGAGPAVCLSVRARTLPCRSLLAGAVAPFFFSFFFLGGG